MAVFEACGLYEFSGWVLGWLLWPLRQGQGRADAYSFLVIVVRICLFAIHREAASFYEKKSLFYMGFISFEAFDWPDHFVTFEKQVATSTTISCLQSYRAC